jgi:hypothetical protein
MSQRATLPALEQLAGDFLKQHWHLEQVFERATVFLDQRLRRLIAGARHEIPGAFRPAALIGKTSTIV